MRQRRARAAVAVAAAAAPSGGSSSSGSNGSGPVSSSSSGSNGAGASTSGRDGVAARAAALGAVGPTVITTAGDLSAAIEEQEGLHPVLEVLRDRIRSGSRPGDRSDGFKLGLAVEGGGMRGIVTGAMLMGLLGLEARSAFDAVYGASAGAINATYFLTGQPEGLDIYTDHLAASDRFLSLRRYWLGGGAPAMDLSVLLDDVMVDVTPLDWQGVVDSEVPLKVVASSLDSLRAEILAGFEGPHDLRQCLRASALVPEIAGPPLVHRGHRLVDAAVFEPVPVKSAVRDGCTHVLALCSRPPSSGPAWGKAVRRTLNAAIKYSLLSPAYMRDAWRVEPAHASHLGVPLEELLEAMAAGGASAGTTIDLSDEEAAWAALGLGGGSSGGGSSASASGSSSPGAASLDGGAVAVAGGGVAAAAAAAARARAADMSGRGSAGGVRAADGVGGSHVFPVYPGSAAAFTPVCTHVPTLRRGRDEGHAAVRRALLPALQARRRRHHAQH